MSTKQKNHWIIKNGSISSSLIAQFASATPKKLKSTRDGFGEGLAEAGQKNPQIVVLSADLDESTRVDKFANLFPQRFVQVGVAEQNMAGLASGLALAGKIPFISSFASFSPSMNWKQLHTACYSNLDIKIASTHAGISTGPDGATHQALEDIALMRVLPKMNVIVPADYEQTKLATQAISQLKEPCYLRLGREKAPAIKDLLHKLSTQNNLPSEIIPPFEIGKAQLLTPYYSLSDQVDVTIIACGMLVSESIQAAEQLTSKKLKVRIINLHTIKPLDTQTVLQAAQTSKFILTAEEHQVAGGMGSAVTEFLAETYPSKIIKVGIKNSFGQSGAASELFSEYEIDKNAIVDRILKELKK